jgi:hypothetical protein
VGLIERHARRLFRSKIRKPARTALKNITRRWCADCQKNVDPFHVCAPRSDFKRRRAQQDRAEQRGQRRGKRANPATPRRERRAHDYTACRDDQCPRPLCQAYREGMAACPLPHQ